MNTTKHIEFKNASGLHIAQVLANKGIYFQVRDQVGEEYAVPKKQVTRGPWDEEELTEQEELEAEAAELNARRGSSLASALAQVTDPEPAPKGKKEKAAPAERDPNLVTLKELCFQLDVIPRIARRKLRKAVDHVGTGGRWEWTKGSPELAAVEKALAGTMPDDDPEALSAEDQAALAE